MNGSMSRLPSLHDFRFVLRPLSVLSLVISTLGMLSALTPTLASAVPALAACHGSPGGIHPMFVAPNEGVSEVGATSAVLEPTICSDGSETQYGLEYATAEAGPWAPVPGGSGVVTAAEGEKTLHVEITGLSPKTRYYVRELLRNDSGETISQPISFETTAPPVTSQPAIGGESATGITEHDATLEAQIDLGELETTYEFWREYAVCQGPSINCGSISVEPIGQGHIAAGDLAQIVSIELTKLPSNYTYTYWVVATNSAGTTEAPHQKFTTLSEATPPKTPEEPAPKVSVEEPAPKASEEPLSQGPATEPLITSSSGNQSGSTGASAQPAVTPVLPASTFATGAPISPPVRRTITSPKSSTAGQKLAGALRACEKRPEKQRAACRKQAYKTYANSAGKDPGKKASEQKHRR